MLCVRRALAVYRTEYHFQAYRLDLIIRNMHISLFRLRFFPFVLPVSVQVFSIGVIGHALHSFFPYMKIVIIIMSCVYAIFLSVHLFFASFILLFCGHNVLHTPPASSKSLAHLKLWTYFHSVSFSLSTEFGTKCWTIFSVYGRKYAEIMQFLSWDRIKWKRSQSERKKRYNQIAYWRS